MTQNIRKEAQTPAQNHKCPKKQKTTQRLEIDPNQKNFLSLNMVFFMQFKSEEISKWNSYYQMKLINTKINYFNSRNWC